MDAPPPYIDPESDHEDRPVCGICPSLRLPRTAFVVYDRPNRECPFNPVDGYRYAADGTPACVHPHKIGLEPERVAPPYTPEPLADEPVATPRRTRWRWPSCGSGAAAG